ncbi:MAG: phosphoserine transaminase [Phycisphaerales bacterium]|nr:phosphoserine transaminase [Phycisphaerales bacterium]
MSTTTVDRIYNFSAGPAVMPECVLEQIKSDVWNIDGSGIGILEHSHRGKVVDRIFEEAQERCRAIDDIPESHEILFIPGGATKQFGMIPLNFLPEGATADYLDTGIWTNKAIKDAKVYGNVNVAFDGSTCEYDHVPTADEISFSADAAYALYCSNITVMGTRFDNPPATTAPLVCDASSEFFGRRMDFHRHEIVFGGAQKNLGPSGIGLVIIDKAMIERACRKVPSMFDYARHAKAGSRMNTPPVFGVYCMNLVFKWILDQGGVDEISRRNTAKAALIYDAIDSSGGFYRGHSRPECRSEMNITFKLPGEDLEARFIEEAAEHSMVNLEGHRSVGGIRASIYNAFPVQGCEALAQFMNDFATRNG